MTRQSLAAVRLLALVVVRVRQPVDYCTFHLVNAGEP